MKINFYLQHFNSVYIVNINQLGLYFLTLHSQNTALTVLRKLHLY